MPPPRPGKGPFLPPGLPPWPHPPVERDRRLRDLGGDLSFPPDPTHHIDRWDPDSTDEPWNRIKILPHLPLGRGLFAPLSEGLWGYDSITPEGSKFERGPRIIRPIGTARAANLYPGAGVPGNPAVFLNVEPSRGMATRVRPWEPRGFPEYEARSGMQHAFPTLLIRAPSLNTAHANLRTALIGPHARNHHFSPTTIRIEGFGNQRSTGEFSYTQKPGKGRYEGGTSSGGVWIVPPEVSIDDHATAFSPAGRTKSTTYFGFAPGVYLAFGVPVPSTGGMKTGYRWSVSAAGVLTLELVNSSGVATTVASFSASGAITGSFPPGGAAGGDLGGTYPDPDVVAVAGVTPGAGGLAVLDDATVGDVRSTLGLATTDSPQFAGVNVGHASDTTLTRTGAGDVAVEGNALYRAGGTDVPVADGGTGASTAAGAAANLGLGTGDSPQFAAVEVGNASDTTLSRASAGNLAVEGNLLYRAGGTDVPVADGGTGASTAPTARDNLGLVFHREVADQTVGNTTTETSVVNAGAGLSIPANTLSTNRVVELMIEGTYLNNTGVNRNLTVRVYYGTTEMIEFAIANIATSANTRSIGFKARLFGDGATNAQEATLEILVSTAGSPATGVGGFGPGASGRVKGTATEDSTGALDVDVTVEHSTNDANLTLTINKVFAKNE